MAKRFFKLLYVLMLIAIGISLPVYLLVNIQFDEIVRTTYRAKCLSNDQYVVLQGSNEIYTFDEFKLNSPIDSQIYKLWGDTKKQLNFSCQYYDEIQPHIIAYIESKTENERINANINFNNFKDGVFYNVNSYPQLYKLEIASEEIQIGKIFYPLLGWIILATLAFLLLQIIRICYVYVVFGKVVWHPFKKIETS